ncbi:MAG: radical SAM protein, partial [Dehalococcoidales bacterium]|nr:radical SAM protein [Dehalococcoidales bacterium]
YRTGTRLRTESILIPDYIDRAEIEKIAIFIAGIDNTIPYRIDAYVPVGDNPWRRPTPQEMEDAVRVARRHLKSVSCLNGDEPLHYGVVRVF